MSISKEKVKFSGCKYYFSASEIKACYLSLSQKTKHLSNSKYYDMNNKNKFNSQKLTKKQENYEVRATYFLLKKS